MEHGRRAGCSVTPDVHHCGNARKLPWTPATHSPATLDLLAPESDVLRGSRRIPARRKRHFSQLAHAHFPKICLCNLGMALSAGCGNIPMVDFGTRILGWENPVTAVAIRAGCGSAVSIRHCAPVHTLPVQLYRVCERDVMPRQKLLVAVTGWRTCLARFFLATSEAASLELWIWWIGPWQEMQLGASGSPEAAAFPWILCLNCFYFIGVALRAFWRELAAPQS